MLAEVRQLNEAHSTHTQTHPRWELATGYLKAARIEKQMDMFT